MADADIDEGGAQIRLQRTRAFLVTHMAMCGLGMLNVGLEKTFGMGQDETQLTASFAAVGAATVVTLVAFGLWRFRRGISILIPAMLFIDSLIVMFQLYQEGDLETAWVAAPLILVFMVPMFSDRPRLVWVIAGIQVISFSGLLYIRINDIWPYQLRTDDFVHDPDFNLFTWVGFTVLVIAAALLAGRTSVDVLNSQRQLDDALKRQEKALARANARIVQQQKLISVEQLTVGIVHEINNPLTFVRTNLGSLTRDLTDVLKLLELYGQFDEHIRGTDPELAEEIDETREDLCLDDPQSVLAELLDDACTGVDRVQNIIHDLRVFSRLDEAERKSVQLREGIESTVKILRRQFDEKQIELKVECADLPEIEVFPALLNQVMMNLVQNAYDAVGAEGRVRIATHASDGGQTMTVEDNGPGIPEEIRTQIFDPFFTTKTVGEGTGLGLSLSMDIVTKHGGQLDVSESEALGGAKFQVFIPRLSRLTESNAVGAKT